MTSNRPYLLRALYDWICDNHLTPYLLIDASGDDLSIPYDFVKDNKIVLNISSSAVRDLDLNNDYISFKARFSGRSMNVYFPVEAVLAIYANENGRGMVFQEEEQEVKKENESVSNSEAVKKETKKKKTPHLKIVK
ncbi:MAG: ClpXP protease specificity-enhancing factor [Proteobacteria bacterium]|nr:ClpXP protease specificity-enhancing factor [Pseudomonadota bacterium]NOG61386.1 ClpXP protease specificity-enhancing factor [Pseudomonadota bacterium]